MTADYFSHGHFLGNSDGVRLRDEVVLSLSKPTVVPIMPPQAPL